MGSLLIVGTQLKMLSGTIARVAEVFESVKQLNETGTAPVSGIHRGCP